MKYIIITSDKYNFLLEGYIDLYRRHWNHPSVSFIILGFSTPEITLPNDFVFHSMGKQSDYSTWSEPIKKYLQKINDKYFFLCFEDHYIVRDINQNQIEEAVNLIDKDETIDKIYFSNDEYDDRILNHYKDNWYISVDRPNALVTTSLLPSIWKTEFFLRMLNTENIKTCHDFEVIHDRMSLNCKVLMPKQTVIYPNLDCMRSGGPNKEIYQAYRNNKSLGVSSWMKDGSDMDIFIKMHHKWFNK